MKIKSFISWTSNDEETIIINTITQKCLILDSTGKILWNMILKGQNRNDIIVECQNKFSSSEKDIINNDIIEFINLLIENDIVEEEGKIK